MDEHAQTVTGPLHGDRVVVVLRRARVDGERDAVAQVAPVTGRRRRIAGQVEHLGLGGGRKRQRGAGLSRQPVQQRAHVPRRAEPLGDARPATARRHLDQHQLALVRDGRAAPAEGQRVARLQVRVHDEEPAAPDHLAADERQRQTRRNLRIVRPEPAAPSPRPASSSRIATCQNASAPTVPP